MDRETLVSFLVLNSPSDDYESVQSVLPDMDDMIGGGLITLERAAVITYRAQPSGSDTGGTA